jgi:hypothetical protein
VVVVAARLSCAAAPMSRRARRDSNLRPAD